MREIRFIDYKVIFGVLVLVAFTFSGSNYLYGLSVPPANDTITAKLTETLKSITSNVSTTVQGDIDKIISDTMDIQINNAMNQLRNTTILGNNDASVPKFETKVPSGIDVFEGARQVSQVHHH
jgi:hypothetical protein